MKSLFETERRSDIGNMYRVKTSINWKKEEKQQHPTNLNEFIDF